jgi:Tfp pilus assembly protein PilN
VKPVNLLPVQYRPRVAGAAGSKTAYVSLGVLALLVLAVFGYVTAANQVNSRNSEIEATRQQIAAAQAQTVSLQGFGNFAGVKEARLSAVTSLATSRLDWERLFREMAHVLPAGVWLTGFNGQVSEADGGGAVGPTVVLDGCADGHERIADVMVRLRELHAAAEVELTETVAGEQADDAPTGMGSGAPTETENEGGCGRFHSFGVSITLAMPSPGVDVASTVPARLGGGG